MILLKQKLLDMPNYNQRHLPNIFKHSPQRQRNNNLPWHMIPSVLKQRRIFYPNLSDSNSGVLINEIPYWVYISSQDVEDTVKGNIKLKKAAAVTQYIGHICADVLDHSCRNEVLTPDGFTILLNSYNQDWDIPSGHQIQDYLSYFHWNQMIHFI